MHLEDGCGYEPASTLAAIRCQNGQSLTMAHPIGDNMDNRQLQRVLCALMNELIGYGAIGHDLIRVASDLSDIDIMQEWEKHMREWDEHEEDLLGFTKLLERRRSRLAQNK